MNQRRWPRILPQPDYPIYQSNDRHPRGFTHQHNYGRKNNGSHPRDYTYQSNPLKKNNDSHPRDYPYQTNHHHNHLRKDNGRHPRGFTHQHYHVQNGGNNAISPSSFYHSCAKFQRMNNSEKRPCNKQAKELCIKQEVPDKLLSRELLTTEDIEKPIVHQGLPQALPSRYLSYRFPDQNPESLQKLCFPSLKQKHGELTTTNTNQAETSKDGSVQNKIPCTDKSEGCEETSSNSSKQSKNDGHCHQSFKHDSSLPIYDKNRNFVVVRKENSIELSARPGEVEKQTLPKAFLDRFENDPEEDDVELLSLDVEVEGNVETKGKDKLEEKMDNSLSKANYQSSLQSVDDPVLSCTNQREDSCSDAESEVFDDVFLKTINKELDDEVSNSFSKKVHDLDEQSKSLEAKGSCYKDNIDCEENEVSSAEGSISPTFDSPLSRYLEDNADTLWENDDQASLDIVPLSKEIEDNDIGGTDISSKLSSSDSNNETVCEGIMLHDHLIESGNTVDIMKEDDPESKNRECVVDVSPRNEKDVHTYLPIEQDSSQSSLEDSHAVSAELIPTENVHSTCDAKDNHTENEKGIEQPVKENEVNIEPRDDCDDGAENTSDVEEAIRLIRAVKSSVKVFESIIKEPLEIEQQKTGNEEDEVSEMAIDNENWEDQQVIAEETNGDFQPLDESLLQTVNREVKSVEGTSGIGKQPFMCDNFQSVNKETSDAEENPVDEKICGVIHDTDECPKSVIWTPSEIDDTTTYDRLHSEVLASKMPNRNKPVASMASNVNKDVGFKDTSNMSTLFSVEVSETVDLESPCQVSRESEEPGSGAEKDDIDDKYPGEPDDSGWKVTEAVNKTTRPSETSVEQETKVEDRNTNDIVSPVETSKDMQDNLHDPASSENSDPEMELSSTSDDGKQDKACEEYEMMEADSNCTLAIEETSKASMIAEDQVAPETAGESMSDIEISGEKAQKEKLNEGDDEESRDVEMSEVEQAVLSISQSKSKSFCHDSITNESKAAVIADYQETLMPECGANNQLGGPGNPVDDQANNNMDSHTVDSEYSQILNAKYFDFVIESNPVSTMYRDETPQACNAQTKTGIESNKNSESSAGATVDVDLCLMDNICEDAKAVEELSNQPQETSTKTLEHQKSDDIEEDFSNFANRQDCNEVELRDAQPTETETTALISKLRELKKNCSVKNLLLDIFAKNTRICSNDTEKNDSNEGRTDEEECDETTEGKDLFEDTPLLRFPSHESIMTDSEHSSTSVEELYVQNLITKADALSDPEVESTSHENSDIESNVQLGKTHENNFTQNTEMLQNITQGNENETSALQNSLQGNESVASLVASLRDSPITSNMEKDDITVQKRGRPRRRRRFRLTFRRKKNKNVASCNTSIKTNKRRSNRQRKARLIEKDHCFNFKSNLCSREIPYCPELYMKTKDKGLSKVSIKREKENFEDDMESADVEIDNEDCLSDDDFHLELNVVDDSLVRSLGIKEKDCSSILSMDDACNLLVSNTAPSGNNSTRAQKNSLENSLRNEVCIPSGSTAGNVPDTLGQSSPEEVCLILASSIPSKNISSSLDESSVETSDATSHWSSSSTASQDIEDPNCQSSTSTEDQTYSSTSATIINDSECSGTRTGEDSLKITLYSERDPSTGITNWTANNGGPVKVTKPIVKKEPFTGYKLRRSKTRKNKKLLPTCPEPQAKRRRITITDLSAESQSPKSLLDLTKKPLENYIKTVEEVYRSPEKNSRKHSISKKDRVNKMNSQDQEGDCLKLGDTELMFELVKKAFGESKIKRCRPSPRSLYFAAKQGNVLQVLILAAGCNVNSTIPQEKHKTAMHAAASAGHADVLGILSLVGGNLSSLDTKLQTPLFDAVEHQQTDVVKFLISQDVNLNLRDSQGMTVLHVAAQKSHVDIIDLLMKTGKLDVNEQDNGGWTALMWTAEGMRMDAAKCLLKWGADVNILDIEQNTCLHWAALSGGTAIMDVLLKAKVDIDARNVFGATALHISARERKLPNITVLAKYRPNLETKNADGKKAIELVPVNSKCYVQLKRMEMLMSFAKCTLKERLITSDVSRGQEQRPIPCVNEVDDETLPDDFVYVSNNLAGQSHCFDRPLTGCNCSDGCVNERQCECAQLSARKRFWYDETGCINSEIFQEDRPLVYECNMKCKCWSNCHQRVVQRGITAGLQLYKTKEKGWAVRTQSLIRKGTFVCEYVGEILTDNEADRREDDCYLFDLDVKGQSILFCLDAKFYGNITRFINHSCDPNILPVRVFTDHQVKNCPRIAFFAARDIKPYEEICSNYGEKFWTVKKSEFNCVCKTTKCKYAAHSPSKK